MTEYIYRVVNSKGEPFKTRIAGSSRNGKRLPQYTVRTYTSSSVALGVATRKNNDLGYDEYRIQASEVSWREFDPITLEMIA